jgi:FKBP-type peptidyl-prolyl cis-trans isomerase FklB
MTGALRSQAQTINPLTPPPSTNDFTKIFSSDQEKNSYAIGMNTAQTLKANLLRAQLNSNDLNMDVVIRGFKEELNGGPTLIDETQQHEILGDLSKIIRARMQEQQKKVAEENKIKGEKNKTDGDAFLTKNKTAAGVVTLPDGVEYIVEKDGSGDSPKPEDEVVVNYTGTLIDGTEFDASSKHGGTATMRANGGIKGWNEAIQLMKAGSKWKVFIPSNLAYGEQARSAIIGPNSTLIFDVELISIKPGKTAAVEAQPHPTQPLTSDIIKVPSQEEMAKGAKIETIKQEDLEKERAKATNQ